MDRNGKRPPAARGSHLSPATGVCIPPPASFFYAHTKGNTTGHRSDGVDVWTSQMYRHLLDQIEVVDDLLTDREFVGACKMVWPADVHHTPFPTRLNVGRYMLAGTFFWFSDRVFETDKWKQIPADRYGAEAWPSVVCPDHRHAATLYQPWPVDQYPTPSPYDPRTHEHTAKL